MSKKGSIKYLCGVPSQYCTGGKAEVSAYLRQEGSMRKVHPDRQSAFNCKKRHLVSQGYTQVGSREFQHPETKEVLVLPKVTKFGARLRPGKEGTRNMPKKKGRSGIII